MRYAPTLLERGRRVLAATRGRHRFLTPIVCFMALAVGLSGCGRMTGSAVNDPPPPRSFMQGGVWFPEATGYWFHQYIEQDELVALMEGVGFQCTSDPALGSGPVVLRMRCERGSRYAWGLLSRSQSARFGLRGNGTIESAEAGCEYTFFGSTMLSGACKRFVALGAVYPTVESFALVVSAMLRPDVTRRPIDVNRLEAGPVVPLKDADEAVDRLTRWRFACEAPRGQYRMEFRGKVGEVKQLRCQQYSLRPPEGLPQSQQVLVHYDSVDLAVLSVEVRLDDASVKLPDAINTPTAERAAAVQPRLLLETLSGQRIEVLAREVGTGSAKATREGFESLTPASQRDLLQAYLDKLDVQWRTPPEKLSNLNATSLEWYGPQALPHLEELLSDERPVVSAAVLKYLCTTEAAGSVTQQGNAFRSEPYRNAMRTCVDRHRDEKPKSIATMDRLLAQNLRELAANEARELNAFLNPGEYILFVFALGPDAKEAGPALTATVAGKEGLDQNLQVLIAAALAPPDRLPLAGAPPAPRAPDMQISREPPAQRPEPPVALPRKSAEQLLAELDAANPRPKDEIRRDLVRMGDTATPALIAILREGTSPNMEFVASVLCLRGPEAAGAIPDLQRIIDASTSREPRSPWPSLYAVSALACVGRQSPEATRYLISLLKGPDAHLRATAASRLYSYQTTDVVLALGEALNDPVQSVRETATGSLFRMGPKASPAIPMLARALDQQKGTYQAKIATDTLRAIGTSEALAELRARGIDR